MSCSTAFQTSNTILNFKLIKEPGNCKLRKDQVQRKEQARTKIRLGF